MTLAQAVILGIVQGLTEFIPVSSTAHLWLVQSFMHLDVDGTAFDIVLHLGTALALIVNFFAELLRMLREAVRWITRKPAVNVDDRALIVPLIVGTIPGALLGILFLSWSEKFRTYTTVGVTMVIASAIFLLAERRPGQKRVPSVPGSIAIGIAQGVAGLFPGFSRSGLTISTGMFTGLRRDCSARFSFLLALPIILGAGAKTLLDIRHGAHAMPQIAVLTAGFLAAAIVGALVIRFLLRYLATRTLRPFAIYLFVVGITLLILSGTGRLAH